jgi:hypothetical protein
MHGVRQVQVVVFNVIDHLVVIGNQVAIDVIAVVGRLLRRGIVVKVTQLGSRDVGRVCYTLKPVAEAVAFI